MINAISKKITLFLGLVGLLVAPASLQCTSDIQKLKILCATHNQVLESGLLSIMHELETSLAYWHTMEDTPFSYAVIRGPKGWISSKTARDEIQTHISVLSKKQEHIAIALGTLSNFENLQDTASNPNELKAAIATCFELSSSLLGQPQPLPQQAVEGDLIDYGTGAMLRLSDFHDNYLALAKNHLKPNHLMRHWTKYTVGALCLIATAAFAYTHQDKLAAWKNEGREALLNFWKKYIKEPIHNSYSILFDKRHSGIVSTESLEGKRTLLRTGLLDFLHEKFPEATQEENESVIDYMMNTKDFSLIQEDLKEQFGSWGTRAYSEIHKKINEDKGWVPWALSKAIPEPDAAKNQNLRLGQDIDLVFQQGLLTADELLQKTQLNLELFAVIPSALGLYGLKKGYDTLFHRKILSEPLQHRLILVDKLLNRYNHGNLQLDVVGTGFLRYHVHALTHYVGRISSGQQKAFKADIAELNNSALNVGQKLRVIDQMYRQYAFLNPLAV